MTKAAWPGLADTAPEPRRRRRLLLLLLAVLLWLPSACTAIISVDLFERSRPDSRIYFTDTSVDVSRMTIQAVGLVTGSFMPGDVTVADLELLNRGLVPVRVAMTVSAEGDGAVLAEALRAAIRVTATTCEAGDGVLLFEGTLAGASFGDGTGTADTTVLDAARRATLCLELRLPLATGDRAQGRSGEVRFLFRAEDAR